MLADANTKDFWSFRKESCCNKIIVKTDRQVESNAIIVLI